MDIAWSEFTPLASFAGGAMIGAAALLLMLLNGRVMGMSGILTGLMVGHADRLWRLAFVAGVITIPLSLPPHSLPSPPPNTIPSPAGFLLSPLALPRSPPCLPTAPGSPLFFLLHSLPLSISG